MPSLITSTEITSFTGCLGDHFDTFKRQIIINKEPKKTIKSGTMDSPAMHGYGRRRQEVSYELVPQSGIYNAIVRYKVGTNETDEDLGFRYPEGTTATIKLDTAGNAYMTAGKTENVVIDGKTFNPNGPSIVQNFLGLAYYIHPLTETT